MMIQVPEFKMKLYSLNIDGPFFLDEKEYESFQKIEFVDV